MIKREHFDHYQLADRIAILVQELALSHGMRFTYLLRCPTGDARRRVLQALARIPCVHTICELGFNSGHSAALWLAADPDNFVVTFDLLLHDYASAAQAFLSTKFPGRLALVAGDSKSTVPGYAGSIAGSGHTRCDLILVDGNHFGDHPIHDLRNFRAMANPDFHVLIMDDVSCDSFWCEDPNAAWKMAKESGLVVEFGAGTNPDQSRGFAIGQYASPGSPKA